MITVHILVRVRTLREGLFAHLQGLPGIRARLFVPGTSGGPDDVVLAAVDSCTPRECSRLKASGFRVVILAPVLREAEFRQYADAGVFAYLPMALDGSQLNAALEDIEQSSGDSWG